MIIKTYFVINYNGNKYIAHKPYDDIVNICMQYDMDGNFINKYIGECNFEYVAELDFSINDIIIPTSEEIFDEYLQNENKVLLDQLIKNIDNGIGVHKNPIFNLIKKKVKFKEENTDYYLGHKIDIYCDDKKYNCKFVKGEEFDALVDNNCAVLYKEVDGERCQYVFPITYFEDSI